ncbi:MAG: uracil-DNA glycosylase [Candidatus Kapabacteria bacterium]|nr:uracil-DNA glycosylase [Ignavibacteriota bacterium]MCW5884546.1 uracil-DNA glycosylase [Candidatus Kapabacteria bacterium]
MNTTRIKLKSEVIDFDKNSLIQSSLSEVEDKVISIDETWQKSQSLDELYSKIHKCTECKLGSTRKSFVFGSGNPDSDILIIGEAPGADEDEQGLPFVGRAGQLLTKILEAIKLSREEVYIANIVKCRPPGNRRPETIEVDTCEPYLKKQIEIIKPLFILSLGLTSVDTLLKTKHKMADIRGKLQDYHGIKMLVTYHPAALLRNPHWKKHVWEDVKYFRSLYDDFLKTKK